MRTKQQRQQIVSFSACTLVVVTIGIKLITAGDSDSIEHVIGWVLLLSALLGVFEIGRTVGR